MHSSHLPVRGHARCQGMLNKNSLEHQHIPAAATRSRRRNCRGNLKVVCMQAGQDPNQMPQQASRMAPQPSSPYMQPQQPAYGSPMQQPQQQYQYPQQQQAALTRRPATTGLQRMQQPQQPQTVFIEMTQVVGKQVITRTTGRNLGVIGTTWVDPVRYEVVSLDLDDKKGVGSTRICNFPLSRLTQIGDVVLVHDEDVLYDQPLDGRYGYYILTGMEVRTRSGEFLGKVRDFTFSPDNGAISRIIYDDFGLSFLPVAFFDTYSLSMSDVVSLGVGGLVVSDESRYRERRESPGLFAAIPSLLRSINSGGSKVAGALTDGYRNDGVAGYLPQGYSYAQWENDVRRWEQETGLSYEQYTRMQRQQQQQQQLPASTSASASGRPAVRGALPAPGSNTGAADGVYRGQRAQPAAPGGYQYGAPAAPQQGYGYTNPNAPQQPQQPYGAPPGQQQPPQQQQMNYAYPAAAGQPAGPGRAAAPATPYDPRARPTQPAQQGMPPQSSGFAAPGQQPRMQPPGSAPQQAGYRPAAPAAGAPGPAAGQQPLQPQQQQQAASGWGSPQQPPAQPQQPQQQQQSQPQPQAGAPMRQAMPQQTQQAMQGAPGSQVPPGGYQPQQAQQPMGGAPDQQGKPVEMAPGSSSWQGNSGGPRN